MSQFIEDVADYLATQGIGTVATDLFIGTLPSEPDNVVSIEATGGVEPDRYLPVKKPTIQVLVRNKTYDGALVKINAVYAALHQKNDSLVLKAGGADVMCAFAMQEPTHLMQDTNERHIFTCNFVFEVRS